MQKLIDLKYCFFNAYINYFAYLFIFSFFNFKAVSKFLYSAKPCASRDPHIPWGVGSTLNHVQY